MMVDEETKIWAAGFFDGEGSLVISKPTKTTMAYLLSTAIGNTVKEVVELFHSNWGGGIHPGCHLPGTVDTRGIKTRRRMWQVVYSEEQAYKLIIDLLPYTKVKKPQFEFAKEFLERIKDLRSLRGRCGRTGRRTGIEQQYRKEAYQTMKRLNKGEDLQDISIPIVNTITIPKLF